MSQQTCILVVDDDPDVRTALALLLKREVSHVVTAADPAAIPGLMHEHQPDVVLLDMNFGPGESDGRAGLDWLASIVAMDGDAVVVAITAHGGVDTAVAAMQRGAMDFIVKPWSNEKLLATVRAALRLRRTQREASDARSARRQAVELLSPATQPILGNSPALRRVLDVVARAAPTEANVLILGENGSGKELIARALHQRSRRCEEVFLTVDLGAVAESVFESELFGHRKGAFTDARSDRTGRFAAASGGTLFLDEIGNLPLHLQAKLLTVLEQREVLPVGADRGVPIDVRVVAATNLPREQLADESRFRQDLLFRLNTVEIELPPLRERREDVPLLVEHFLRQFERKYQRPQKPLANGVMVRLCEDPWPGNVRALRHSVERAVILAAGHRYELEDFSLAPMPARGRDDAAPAPSSGHGPPRAGGAAGGQPATPAAPAAREEDLNLERIERETIHRALVRHGYNISKASRALGLTRAALYRRMEKHGL